MAAALLAVAANLRVVIASVPPLLDTISQDLGLSHAAAGALTTLPVLCMGVFAPIASRIAHRFGAVAAVLGAVVCILIGSASRYGGGNWLVLYLGTFVAGVGIAVAGTLLPRLVKTFFPPERVGLLTGLYMFAMMGAATVSSAISVPLAQRLGSWQASLGSWTLLALVGLLAWAPFARRANPHHTPDETGPGRLPFRQRTAWLLGGYLALQSWCFYSAVTWLPPTYLEHGWTTTDAGYLAAVFAGTQVVSGLLGPLLSDRVADMRWLLIPSAVLATVGCLGIYLAPLAVPWVWAAVTGLGQGSSFSLALVLLVRYTTSPEASGRLTGMAFLICYGLASLGPLTMGLVRDLTGGLSPVWLILFAVGVAQVVVILRLRPSLPKVT